MSGQTRTDLASADALLARLIKLTSRKEDFLTECFAAVIQADTRARVHYWRLLSSTLPRAVRAAAITSVRTQCLLGGRKARCDLVFTVGKENIVVEHKLNARQGHDQLERYLSLSPKEANRVAFIAADYQGIPPAALGSARYVRPGSGHPHFVWADFYPVIRSSEKRGYEVAAATRGLFDRLGLQPAHPLIGDLNTRDPERRKRLDARMHTAWQPLLRALGKRWKFAGSSIRKDRRSEIYIIDGRGRELGQVWLDPFSNPGSLRVRLKSTGKPGRDMMLSRIVAHRKEIPCSRHFSFEAGARSTYKQRFPWAIEGRVPWRALLGRADRGSLPGILKRFVTGLISVADPAA